MTDFKTYRFPKTLVHGQVYSIPMPLDKNGNGPVPPDETVITYYEVWDQVCNEICRCRSEDDANLIVELINQYWDHKNGY